MGTPSVRRLRRSDAVAPLLRRRRSDAPQQSTLLSPLNTPLLLLLDVDCLLGYRLM